MDSANDDLNNNTNPDGQVVYKSADVIHDPPHQLLRRAVTNFEVGHVKDLLLRGLLSAQDANCRTLLHDLALAFSAVPMLERPPDLKLKFIDILTALTKHGVDVNAVNYSRQTTLHILAGAGAGQADVIKVLLASGVKVNAQDRSLKTAVHIAVARGARKEVEALLEGGANPNLPNATGYTALHLAAKRKRNGPLLELLLAAGAQVNQQPRLGRNSEGATPLHLACKMGCPQNVSVLLHYSANPDLVDTSGQSSLHVAAARDMSCSIVERLLRAGASVNAQDTMFRETPLHKAIRFHMFGNIRVILESGKSYALRPNTQDAQGNTALHQAAEGITDIATLTLLMKSGADPKCLNIFGQSPESKATRAKNANAVSVIRQYEEVMSRQEIPKVPSPYTIRKLPGLVVPI